MSATDLHQVLINLFTNASDAMPEGGRIRVSTEATSFDETAAAASGVRPGRYVWLVVSDSGHGLSPDVRERIFEPRFSTKPAARNSGMGLAVVQGIVRRYGGIIECASEPGRGATFRVLLPAAEAGPSGQSAGAAPAVRHRILFVDDEPEVVRMGREMLESLGYEVEGSTSSRQALQAFRAAPARYDLVLTDQTMPELNGDALVREIRRVRPGVPVILCSGYHERIGPETAAALSIQACLQKPIDIDTLSRVLQNALSPVPVG
jgi:CheY-like chemotaxis protein